MTTVSPSPLLTFKSKQILCKLADSFTMGATRLVCENLPLNRQLFLAPHPLYNNHFFGSGDFNEFEPHYQSMVKADHQLCCYDAVCSGGRWIGPPQRTFRN